MEREQILAILSKLPEIHAGKFPIDDDEIWEGDEMGAHFKITKNFVTIRNLSKNLRISYLVLSISGQENGKEKIIGDFTKALGEPTDYYENPSLPGISFVSWNTI